MEFLKYKIIFSQFLSYSFFPSKKLTFIIYVLK